MSEEALLREKTATLARMLNSAGHDRNVRPCLDPRAGHRPSASSARAPAPTRPRCGAEQIFVYNIDGTIIEHPGGLIPLEWRIHTQIHRDRPDAMCVVHLHAPHARALGIAGKELKPVFLHGSFLCTGVPTWDNPRLVVNDEQAADLSRALGDQHVRADARSWQRRRRRHRRRGVLRLHVPEENAQIQLQAEIMGGAIPLSEDEARDCAEGTFNPRLFPLLWNYYERKVRLD